MIIDVVAVAVCVAVEANPLMAYLLDHSPVLFFFVKMSVVFLAVLILYYRRCAFLTRVLVIPVALIYAAVLILHLSVIGPPGL